MIVRVCMCVSVHIQSVPNAQSLSLSIYICMWDWVSKRTSERPNMCRCKCARALPSLLVEHTISIRCHLDCNFVIRGNVCGLYRLHAHTIILKYNGFDDTIIERRASTNKKKKKKRRKNQIHKTKQNFHFHCKIRNRNSFLFIAHTFRLVMIAWRTISTYI